MNRISYTRNGTSRHGLMKAFALSAVLVSAALLTASCTTATYGDEFVPDGKIADQYTFRIYVGGFQFAPPESEAKERAEEYMQANNYSSYEIVDRQYVPFPSYYEFTVRYDK